MKKTKKNVGKQTPIKETVILGKTETNSSIRIFCATPRLFCEQIKYMNK